MNILLSKPSVGYLAAQPAGGEDAGVPAQRNHDDGRRETLVETVIGIALIVIAALEILFIVRTVQANMGRP
jgi:hypothetical protein